MELENARMVFYAELLGVKLMEFLSQFLIT